MGFLVRVKIAINLFFFARSDILPPWLETGEEELDGVGGRCAKQHAPRLKEQ